MRPSRRRLLDVAYAVWAMAWVVIAVQVAVEVRGLRDLSETVKQTGVAVRESGVALERLEGLPTVGEGLGDQAERIKRAGESAVQSGESSGESIQDLSILLAIAIGVIPAVALLGLFLELRSAATALDRRDRRLTAD